MRVIAGRALVGAVATIALLPGIAWAGSGVTLGRYATSTVDGRLSSGEYGSSCVGPVRQPSGSKSYRFTICEQNDGKNVYFAISINDPLSLGFDAPMLWFDNNNDGHVAAGDPNGGCPAQPAPVEDAMSWSIEQSGVYEDSYSCFTSSGPNAGWSLGFDAVTNIDGQGSCVPNPANTAQTCEFSKPLRSGDLDDFSLVPGDTIGWCFTYNDRSNPTNALGTAVPTDVQYPVGCWLDKTAHHDTLSGSTTRYANALIHSDLSILVKTIDVQLGRYLLTCQFCPPDPTKQLQGELRLTRSALAERHRDRAARALRSFVSSIQRLVRNGLFPAKSADVLIPRARRIIFELEHPPWASKPPTRPANARKVKLTIPVGGG